MGTIPLVALMGKTPIEQGEVPAVELQARRNAIKSSQQQQQQSAALFPGEQQLQQQQITQGQMGIEQQKAVNDAWKAAAQPDAQGRVNFDPDKLTNALALSGHGSAVPAIAEGLMKMQQTKGDIAKQKADLATAEADTAGEGAASVIASNFDPNVKAAFFQHLNDAGYGQQAQQLQKYLQQVGPQGEPQVWQSLRQASPKQQQLDTEKLAAQARMATANKPTEASLAVSAAGGDQGAKSALGVLADQKGQITPAIQYAQQQENYRAALARAATNGNELQKAGITNLQKQSDTYSQFLNTAESLKSSLAAAKNGNEMAAAVAPLQGTLFVTTAEGVKRINQTELSNIAGAGSLVQRINGELGKQTGEGPLSNQLKDDMGKLVDLYADTKYGNYQKQAAYTQKLHGLDPEKTPILGRDGSISESGGEQPKTEPFKPPAGAPSAQGLSDGHKLKDAKGNVVAVSKGGQWAAPTP